MQGNRTSFWWMRVSFAAKVELCARLLPLLLVGFSLVFNLVVVVVFSVQSYMFGRSVVSAVRLIAISCVWC